MLSIVTYSLETFPLVDPINSTPFKQKVQLFDLNNSGEVAAAKATSTAIATVRTSKAATTTINFQGHLLQRAQILQANFELILLSMCHAIQVHATERNLHTLHTSQNFHLGPNDMVQLCASALQHEPVHPKQAMAL